MNLFLVQSEKTREINGITQTESKPIIKAQYSRIDIFYEVGTLSSIKTVCWWLIGFSWRFSLHGHRTYACMLPVLSASPQRSVSSVCLWNWGTSPHLCVAIKGFEYQLGCSFSVILDCIYKMKIAALISLWTICRPHNYVRKPWHQMWLLVFNKTANILMVIKLICVTPDCFNL